jgi:hypothetical protein
MAGVTFNNGCVHGIFLISAGCHCPFFGRRPFENNTKKAMQLQPVNSSAIAAVGYENGTLAVQFHNNPEPYELPNVP